MPHRAAVMGQKSRSLEQKLSKLGSARTANVFHPFSLAAKSGCPVPGLLAIPNLMHPSLSLSLFLIRTVPPCSASQPAVLKNVCFLINHPDTMAAQLLPV